MANIMVKSNAGGDVEVPTTGKANAGLALGIIGTTLGGLALLGGGVLGLARENSNMANLNPDGSACCFVNKDTFYSTLISQINQQAERDIATERRFAGLESAIATNAAVSECNKAAINREFSVVDERFTTERYIDDLILRNALCEATKNMIKGETYLSPSSLADSFISPSRALDSYVPREYLPARPNCGYGASFGYDGCGCNCGVF